MRVCVRLPLAVKSAKSLFWVKTEENRAEFVLVFLLGVCYNKETNQQAERI